MEFELTTTRKVILVVAVVWELTWKGFALWRGARHKQPYWYVAILIINTVGILPIIYLLTHERR